MAMIVWGVILIVCGLASLISGSMMNNNTELRWNTWFETGRTNPGQVFVIIGIVVLAVGGVLLIAGIVKNIMNSHKGPNTEPMSPAPMPTVQAPKPVNSPDIPTTLKSDTRIKRLDDLLSRGYITFEEYREKVKAIIDDFENNPKVKNLRKMLIDGLITNEEYEVRIAWIKTTPQTNNVQTDGLNVSAEQAKEAMSPASESKPDEIHNIPTVSNNDAKIKRLDDLLSKGYITSKEHEEKVRSIIGDTISQPESSQPNEPSTPTEEKVFCIACGSEMSEEDMFCPQCGAKQEKEAEILYCESCGAELKPGVRFCTKCGGTVK